MFHRCQSYIWYRRFNLPLWPFETETLVPFVRTNRRQNRRNKHNGRLYIDVAVLWVVELSCLTWNVSRLLVPQPQWHFRGERWRLNCVECRGLFCDAKRFKQRIRRNHHALLVYMKKPRPGRPELKFCKFERKVFSISLPLNFTIAQETTFTKVSECPSLCLSLSLIYLYLTNLKSGFGFVCETCSI